MTDDEAATNTQTVTITITGTNDAPVITAAASGRRQRRRDAADDVDAGAPRSPARSISPTSDFGDTPTATVSTACRRDRRPNASGGSPTPSGPAHRRAISNDVTNTGPASGTIDWTSTLDLRGARLSRRHIEMTYTVGSTDDDGSTPTPDRHHHHHRHQRRAGDHAAASGLSDALAESGRRRDAGAGRAVSGTLDFSDVDLGDTPWRQCQPRQPT